MPEALAGRFAVAEGLEGPELAGTVVAASAQEAVVPLDQAVMAWLALAAVAAGPSGQAAKLVLVSGSSAGLVQLVDRPAAVVTK